VLAAGKKNSVSGPSASNESSDRTVPV
jgi:hypothetical protein